MKELLKVLEFTADRTQALADSQSMRLSSARSHWPFTLKYSGKMLMAW